MQGIMAFHTIGRQCRTAGLYMLLTLLPLCAAAHQSPNTMILLDITPAKVSMELQLPVPELELAFGNNISKEPGKIIERFGPQLKEYLLAHIKVYSDDKKMWQINIASLSLSEGTYDNGYPYWEVVAGVTLLPATGSDTRNFFLDYDVIMHQVMNHVAFVSVRSDWENGQLEAEAPAQEDATVIMRDNRDNLVHPLSVHLRKGSNWQGFNRMLSVGMQHIKEGTDHLLFLLVLLLPATLLVNGRRWGAFGGTRYSITRLLKIVTAFTIGHSLTLLVGAAGWVKLPTQPVEIAIAFSILVSAIHAIRPLFPGRESYVAAGFGLIHGLAFAGILANLHLTAGTLAISILGFNLGIELMQLFIIALIVPWLILAAKTPYYKWLRITGAMLAGIAALAWMAERTTGESNFITRYTNDITGQGVGYITGIAVVCTIMYVFHRLLNKRYAYRRVTIQKQKI
ncbi:MAG: HupE/UreJ family protein [Ferruginibacter sp.]